MKIVLCGLSLSGKSTVFKALVGKAIAPKTSAKGKVHLNIATLELSDSRLTQLAQLVNSQKVTYPQISLVDLTLLAEASSQKLNTSHLRDYDALAIVIGSFSGQDPVADLANIQAELILSDLELIQNRIARINKENKAKPKKEADAELLLCQRIAQALEKETLIKDIQLNPDELKVIAGFQLLTLKPTIVIANISEEQLKSGGLSSLENKVKEQNLAFFAVCAQLEAEIEELAEQERPQFMQEMGLSFLSKDTFVPTLFKALGRIMFFTVVGKEARAWAIAQGTTALAAAGCVHSDMEKGFIRAEVINYQDFIQCGSFAKAKEKGLLRLESKEYPVQDGDIINFKFSV